MNIAKVLEPARSLCIITSMLLADRIRYFALGTAVLLTQSASAAVIGYGASFYEDYRQTDNAGTLSGPSVAIQTYLQAQAAGEIDAAVWASPASSPSAFYLVAQPALFYGSSGYYTSVADLAVDYPDGTWPFKITAGTAADSADLEVPKYDFPSEIPVLVNDSYANLFLAPAGVDAPVEIKPFKNDGRAPDLYAGYTIYDFTNSTAYAYSTGGPGGTWTGSPIPASVMKSGHFLGLYLNTYATLNVPNAGFGGAPSSVSFLRRNYHEFPVKADPGTIAGVITLRNSNYFYGEPIAIEVLDGDGSVLETHSLSIDVYGHYAFDSALGGTYDIRYKGRHWLSNVVTKIDFSVGQNFVDVSLTNGDVDGDNTVSLFDYLILSEYFDKSYQDSDWTTVGANGWAPRDADLDNDGYVALFDYLYLSDAFDQSGL